MHNLVRLPAFSELKTLTQSLAVLDAILCPDWQFRYHSFNTNWDAGEMMASMRDGSGDHYFLLFTKDGAILKGFAHECAMTPFRVNPPQVWPGVFDSVPDVFAAFLTEPAFSMEETTFCLWRTHTDTHWQCGTITFPDGEDPDGSRDLLALLDGNPRTYQAWAEGYFEQDVDLAAVQAIYRHEPVTDELVEGLNPETSVQSLKEDLHEIGYPA